MTFSKVSIHKVFDQLPEKPNLFLNKEGKFRKRLMKTLEVTRPLEQEWNQDIVEYNRPKNPTGNYTFLKGKRATEEYIKGLLNPGRFNQWYADQLIDEGSAGIALFLKYNDKFNTIPRVWYQTILLDNVVSFVFSDPTIFKAYLDMMKKRHMDLDYNIVAGKMLDSPHTETKAVFFSYLSEFKGLKEDILEKIIKEGLRSDVYVMNDNIGKKMISHHAQDCIKYAHSFEGYTPETMKAKIATMCENIEQKIPVKTANTA